MKKEDAHDRARWQEGVKIIATRYTLQSLFTGSHYLKNGTIIIKEAASTPRSYHFETPNGTLRSELN